MAKSDWKSVPKSLYLAFMQEPNRETGKVAFYIDNVSNENHTISIQLQLGPTAELYNNIGATYHGEGDEDTPLIATDTIFEWPTISKQDSSYIYARTATSVALTLHGSVEGLNIFRVILAQGTDEEDILDKELTYVDRRS